MYLIADPNSFQTCLKLVVASNYTEPCVVFQILPAYIYKKYNMKYEVTKGSHTVRSAVVIITIIIVTHSGDVSV